MKDNVTATITDVAKLAEVSPSTVSRVINNHSRISPATVLKVRNAISQVGYSPLPSTWRRGHRPKRRRPSSYRKMQIALISQVKSFWMDTPIYSKVMRAIESELGDNYYNLIIRNLPAESVPEAIQHNIDGAILFNVHEDPKMLKRLRTMPCVRVMCIPRDNDLFDHITYNDYSIGRQAAEYLLERGHRDIVYLGADPQKSFTPRYNSFLSIVENTKINFYKIFNNALIDESQNMQCPNTKELGKVIKEMKRLPKMPTAVFVPADIITIGLYHTLHHYGIMPGKDIEIIGVNNDAMFLNSFVPRPASIDIHPDKIGHEAVKRLFWRIKNPEEPLVKVEFEPVIAFK